MEQDLSHQYQNWLDSLGDKKKYVESSTFCILPWVHLCVRPNESLKPCCRYQLSDDSPLNANLDSLESNGIHSMNNDYLTNLRQDMLDGVKRPECIKCYLQEQNKTLTDRKSLRDFLNWRLSPCLKDNYTSKFDIVRYIEMSLDNICNLQCKMCDSNYSSKLQLRDEFLGYKVAKKLEPNFHKFKNIDLSNLVYIKLLGGEPFITPNFVKFLDYVEKRADPTKIALEIATNATRIPNQKIIDKLNKYKFLHINVSLDAYDKTNDYQRFGSNYVQIYNNAKAYETIFFKREISFHSTTGLLTANKLSDSLNFLTEENKYHVSVDFIRYPHHLSLLYAPQSYLDWVLEKNSNNSTALKLVNTFIQSGKFNKEHWFNFLENTKKLDTFYSTNIRDYNPELVAYLEDNGYG